jgi:UPF0716 family protein affecting phage T7 exclusion
MATQVDSVEEPGIAKLLGGIAQDARRLLMEQMQLFHAEIKKEVQHAVQGLIPLVAGAVIMVPGLLLVAMAAAYGLCWAYPNLPTWGGFAIVGGVILAVGGLMVLMGTLILRTTKLVPETALKELKENIAVLGERKENDSWQVKK